MTWNVLHASWVASGRWSNSGGGLLDIFCDDLCDSFGVVPFSMMDVLSPADFASSSDMLDAGESILAPLGVAEPLISSLLSLGPLDFGRSSNLGPATVPKARPPPSIATKCCARSATTQDKN